MSPASAPRQTPSSLRAVAVALLLVPNLALWGTLVFLGGMVKRVTWGEPRRRVILRMAALADCWVAVNDRIFDLLLDTRWEVEGVEGIEGLHPGGRYLIISNHVSWIDIFAVFRALHRRAAFIRFFLKRQLLWFPFAGQACWALEFPFMRRYSPEYLARHPEKRGRDLETTRLACRRYRDIPVTILNFLEGTRFTREKHEDQGSPYRHLLRPRVGGIGFVAASMAEELDAIIDLTIVYPNQDATLWQFVSNRLPWVAVHARKLELPPEFRGGAMTQPGPERERFKEWVETIWREKDRRIETMLQDRN